MTPETPIEWQPLIDLAMQLCLYWHAGQKDRAGSDYSEHPIEVARRVQEFTQDPAAYCVALLHDTIEDTNMPPEQLESFPERVMYAVLALSRWPDESANAYCRRVLDNPLASIVKIYDIEHNFSPGRMDPKILEKASMYAEWHRKLCNALRIDRSFCLVHSAV